MKTVPYFTKAGGVFQATLQFGNNAMRLSSSFGGYLHVHAAEVLVSFLPVDVQLALQHSQHLVREQTAGMFPRERVGWTFDWFRGARCIRLRVHVFGRLWKDTLRF